VFSTVSERGREIMLRVNWEGIGRDIIECDILTFFERTKKAMENIRRNGLMVRESVRDLLNTKPSTATFCSYL
jgi:hypothetical protein